VRRAACGTLFCLAASTCTPKGPPSSAAQGAFDAGPDSTTDTTGAKSAFGSDGSNDLDALGPDACAPPVAEPQVLSGEVVQVVAACGVDGGAPPLVGPVPSSTMLDLSIGLPVRNQAQLNQYLQQVSDPTSPLYRQYLTEVQYTAMFGPTECDYAALIAWATSQGFVVAQMYSDRTLLDVTAQVSAANAALHVTFNYYLRPYGTQFYAPNQDPSLDLSVQVLAIDGLDNCVLPMPGGAVGDP